MDLPPVCTQMHPPCIYASAEKYQLPPLLLMAVRKVEGGRVGQKKQNKDLSFDYGEMQINTFWTRRFQAWYGISADQIANDVCLNYDAAAFVLRYEINRAKGDFWLGVGRYHSPEPSRIERYRRSVYVASESIRKGSC